MAVYTWTDASITINAVDLSDHVRSASLSLSIDDQDSSAMGSTFHSRAGGLKDWSLEIEFNSDFAAAKVDATLWPIFASASGTTTVTAKATSAANSATNPQFSGTGLLTDYTPLDGSVGDMATSSCTFAAAGTLSRLTS